MATPTPNNPNPPKKPAATPPAKPGAPPAKTAANGPVNGAGGPPARPAPAAKPAAGPPPAGKPVAGKPAARPPAKPGAKPAAKPGAKPPAEPKTKAWVGADGGNRKFGQVLVDLGYLDQEQLWDLLEEARNADVPLARIVLDRGLVTDDQLLQAKGEMSGVPVVNLEETKPTPEAIKLVPENMATVYKVLP